MRITGVQPHELADVMPLIGHYFNSFVSRAEGEIEPGELVAQVARGERQCWIAVADGPEIKACALTQVLANPKKTVVLDFCAGRDREEWRDAMVAEIEAWAAHLGSRRVRIVCRPGWARELTGYRETHRVVEKDIG